jgi:probable addiction module antidote protein
MNQKTTISSLKSFDMAENLRTEEDVANYLTVVMEDNDPSLLAAALGDIARARGMAQIAQAAGIGRESLYKALRPDSQPRFDTIQRVCAALGVRLTATPIRP